jgi:sigma-B regulation protein RsbU (phosphoserine phosphatase)
MSAVRESGTEGRLRDQLRHRRERLQAVVRRSGEAADLVRLLQEVDAALERMESGSFGTCEVCHTAIDTGDLMANPTMRYCLCDLSPEQQRALESDLELAARIQGGLLPEPDLEHGGWEVHYRYEPAGVVSGDYCDVLTPVAHDGLYFAIGDVSGKGVAASLLMAHLNASFRTLGRTSPPVPSLMESASRLFLESSLSSYYATLVCGRASSSGTVEICGAGHCSALLVTPDSVREIESAGPPIGLFRDQKYESTTLRADPGDLLFLYTDGLTESRNPAGAEYGMERLCGLLGRGRAPSSSTPPISARNLAGAVLADLDNFRAGEPRTDDLTLLVLRRSA